MNNHPNMRTPPRLAAIFDRYESPRYFVTFCTSQRRKVLADPAGHDAFQRSAERGKERAIAVGRYVIMPDHVHVFVTGGRGFSLSSWVRLLKNAIGKEAGMWQRGFFDHLIRHGESYGEKWESVRQNPVRAGLVARPEEWPDQGEIVALEYR